uniref:Acyl-coenzyme A oxidase n=1 Tax=Hyaloperonospora arabidopsidis (strain Emoy2) TaxID=559515 RepID=M4C1G4_HYAAE
MTFIELKDLAPLLLKKERANGDIDPSVLTNVLRGGRAASDRRRELVKMVEQHPVLSDRDMVYRNHTERYSFGLRKAFYMVKLFQQGDYTDKEETVLLNALGEQVPLDLHRNMFIPTIKTQGTDEQRAKWLPLAKKYRIIGTYAQTELGHGSNVQGIETIATYDTSAREFVIDSPTLTSRKWWPGGLGKTATHAIVIARLVLGKQDVGLQSFIVQIRSLADHTLMPGIKVRDIGPKIGFNAIDNGECTFDKVRIPRENMMMRYAKVLKNGSFVKPRNDKLVYLTMVQVRASLIKTLGDRLAAASTIATRFSAARVQGHKPSQDGEFQVLDYQNQQYALFPLIAISYASHFAGSIVMEMHDAALESIKSEDVGFGAKLAELHNVSSGLKAWISNKVGEGIEVCRRLCGGHGFSQSSNLGHLFAEIAGANTFEGTSDVLVQQHTRYLLKKLASLTFDDKSAQLASNAKSYPHHELQCKAEVPADFSDFNLLMNAFRARATRSLLALMASMEAINNDGNANMIRLTHVSITHTELMVMESFVRGVESLPVGTEKQCLTNLCSLLGAWLITKSLGDFRQDNYLSSKQAQLVREQVVHLLPVIRKNCVLLTDAWDFSDFELNSTIGRYDGDIYRALLKRVEDEPLNQTEVASGYEKYLKPLIQSGL